MKGHFVIFNPAAGRGRGARRIAEYRRLLGKHLPDAVTVHTSGPGDESRLASKAVAEGFDAVVAVGGDGTLGHVANAIIGSGRPNVALGVLPNGTGNDFCRNLGLHPHSMAEAVRTLAEGHVRRVDVGRIETASGAEDGSSTVGFHFLNVVGFGFDVAVIRAAARNRLLKGEVLYKVTALQQLFRFPGFTIQLRTRPSDGESGHDPDESEGEGSRRTGRMLMFTVSNGTYFGGGFPISPGAEIADGMLHACRIRDGGPFTRMKLFGLAQKGRHVDSDSVFTLKSSSFAISCPEPVAFEADGDVRRSLGREVVVSVVPEALRVVAPMPSRAS